MERKKQNIAGPIDLCVRANGVQRSDLRKHVLWAGQQGYAAVALEQEVALPATGSESVLQPISEAELGDKLHQAPVQLIRITAVLSEPRHANSMRAQAFVRLASLVDLVAVRPTTDRCFELACSECPATLLQLELHKRMPFRLRGGLLKMARSRNIKIEALVAPVKSSAQARRQAIASGHSLALGLRVPKDTVLSSGATANSSAACTPREACALYALVVDHRSIVSLVRCIAANAKATLPFASA